MCAHTQSKDRHQLEPKFDMLLSEVCILFLLYFLLFYFISTSNLLPPDLQNYLWHWAQCLSWTPRWPLFLCRTFDTNQIIIQNSISCDLVVISCSFNVWLLPSSLMWHYGNQFSWFTIKIYFVWGLLIKIIRNNSSDKSINFFLIIHEMIW